MIECQTRLLSLNCRAFEPIFLFHMVLDMIADNILAIAGPFINDHTLR